MKKIIFASLLAVAPVLVFAAPVAAGDLSNISTLINKAQGVINLLVGFMFALAVLVFFFGLVRYIASAGNEEAKGTAKRLMIGGIIALFVMTTLYGILAFLSTSVGLNNDASIGLPDVETLN